MATYFGALDSISPLAAPGPEDEISGRLRRTDQPVVTLIRTSGTFTTIQVVFDNEGLYPVTADTSKKRWQECPLHRGKSTPF